MVRNPWSQGWTLLYYAKSSIASEQKPKLIYNLFHLFEEDISQNMFELLSSFRQFHPLRNVYVEIMWPSQSLHLKAVERILRMRICTLI